MSDIRLTTPDGYFEKSLEKTLASADRVSRHRRTFCCLCAAVILVTGTFYSIHTIKVKEVEKEYLAQQAELARLDIFLEIN